MFCRVCSLGEELDLFRGCEGWKERFIEGRVFLEETVRSMGIFLIVNFFLRNDFFFWLEVEDDWKERI